MANTPISNLPVAVSLSGSDVTPWVVSGNTSKLTWTTLQTLIQALIPASPIPAGTVMLFYQAAAPTGWTQVVSQTDKVLRVVSGTGAGTGGSWTISGISVDGHALTVAETPPHTHSFSVYNTAGGSNPYFGGGGPAASVATSSSGSGASHTHSLTIGSSWRPAYIDVIICSKDA